MIPANTNLDFYAKPLGHREQAKRRLDRQRAEMYGWRTNAADCVFHPVTGARIPKKQSYPTTTTRQVLLPGSQRAMDEAEAERQRVEAKWVSAAAANAMARDRRREWRDTGFVFDEHHFDHSSRQAGKPQQKSLSGGRVRHPYVPYFHDSAIICDPYADADSRATATAFAVTCNRAEAEAEEAAATAEEGASPASLGPALATRQKAVTLVENMYDGLVSRQAALTGTAVGSKESLDVRLPTSELAYTLRESYLAKSQRQFERQQQQQQQQEEEQQRQQQGEESGDAEWMAADDAAAASRLHSSTSDGRLGASSRTNAPGGHHPTDAHSAPHHHVNSNNDDNPFHDVGEGIGDGSMGGGEDAHESHSSSQRHPADNRFGGSCSTAVPNAMQQHSPEHPTPSQGLQDGTQQLQQQHGLPGEAKAVRLYAVTLRKAVKDQDTSMVRRTIPERRGVPVVIPEEWGSPMS